MSRVAAVGALLGGLAVALAAVGDHALSAERVPAAPAWWQTGVHYLLVHAVAVVAFGLSGRRALALPAGLLGGGALIFAVALMTLALGAPPIVGAVTPLGGLAMIGGWALAGWRLIRASD